MLTSGPFTIRLAGTTIRVQVRYKRTKNLCRDYICSGEPDFSVCVTPEDIIREREAAARQDARAGSEIQVHDDAYLETLALYRKIADCMALRNILLVHGSCICVDGQGYLFTAPSGTGKSTHTRLWRELLGERAIMINDDKPLVSIGEQGAYVHGTPWCGKHRMHTNLSVPLRGICILSRGETDRIRPITGAEAMPVLLQQTHRPKDARGMCAMLASVEHLMGQVRLYRLECTMNIDAARVACAAMAQND